MACFSAFFVNSIENKRVTLLIFNAVHKHCIRKSNVVVQIACLATRGQIGCLNMQDL